MKGKTSFCWGKNKIIILIIILLLAPVSYFGHQVYSGELQFKTVLSGSMSPAINAGDIILISKINTEEVEERDIITFREGKTFTTHRVIEIVNNTFRTKGDANEEADMKIINGESVVGKVIFTIPFLGRFTHFVRSPLGFMIFILIPGILIIISEIKKILNETKRGTSKKQGGYSFKKSASVFIILISFSAIVSLSYAFFNDFEISRGNTQTAGTLDFSLEGGGFSVADLEPENPEIHKINVTKLDSQNFQYNASITKTGGDDNFCGNLSLESKLNEEIKYSGRLLGFNFAPVNISGSEDEWTFNITLTNNDTNLQNKTCNFTFSFKGWQTNLDSSLGFSDEEEISNSVKSGEGTQQEEPATFSISLNSPANETITDDNTTDFNFTVSGSESNYECVLYLNDTNKGNNNSVSNDTLTTITSSEISDGTYNWHINCTANGTTNRSETREITINTTQQVNHIVINEIQIKDNEFVELYNPTDSTINMTDWHWSYFPPDKNWNESTRNKPFPIGATIKSYSYYLIGLKGYNESISDWQVYTSTQLGNNKGSVGIFPFDPNTKTSEEAKAGRIDAVGWGSVTHVYENQSAAVPDTNKSIERNSTIYAGYDTDDNSLDFIINENPTPTNSTGG
ncbi:MAG: signal peptidase I [Candidatus Aenigmarchaeota archaeon]|nr:signal peptidase I [Candidatus Aenigmarchaeota archaeon]